MVNYNLFIHVTTIRISKFIHTIRPSSLSISLTYMKYIAVYLCALHESILSKEEHARVIVTEECVERVSNIIDEQCTNAADKSRTGKLWIQYYRQVSLIRMFIRAERTGDWELHLHCIRQMLPHFHAAGHIAYAKSAHLYTQQMLELPHKMPAEEYTVNSRRRASSQSGYWKDFGMECFRTRPSSNLSCGS